MNETVISVARPVRVVAAQRAVANLRVTLRDDTNPTQHWVGIDEKTPFCGLHGLKHDLRAVESFVAHGNNAILCEDRNRDDGYAISPN